MSDFTKIKILSASEAMTCINVFAITGRNPASVPLISQGHVDTVPACKALESVFGCKVTITKETAIQLYKTTQYSLSDIMTAFDCKPIPQE